MKKQEHGIYKYVYNNEVIYIGKTDAENGFKNRINRHKKEHELFNKSKIYVYLCKDQTETDSLETILINAYKPMLNKAKLYDYKIVPPELKWIPWELYVNKEKVVKLDDIIYCIENGKSTIKIGEKYHDRDFDISTIVDSFEGIYPIANFFDEDGIRIGGNMKFPTKRLLLEMKRQIDYSLENYDTLKDRFVLTQCEKAKEIYLKKGFVIDVDIMENTEEVS